jgi:hypothetical protein
MEVVSDDEDEENLMAAAVLPKLPRISTKKNAVCNLLWVFHTLADLCNPD